MDLTRQDFFWGFGVSEMGCFLSPKIGAWKGGEGSFLLYLASYLCLFFCMDAECLW